MLDANSVQIASLTSPLMSTK